MINTQIDTQAAGKRTGFTLIELLVVIAIIAILAAILFPVFARARENARRAACQSNLKQVGLTFMQYAQDFDEMMPNSRASMPNGTGVAWDYALEPYMMKATTGYATGNNPLLRCPSDGITPTNGSGSQTFPMSDKRSYAIPMSNSGFGSTQAADYAWKGDNFTNTPNARKLSEFPNTAQTLLLVEAPTSPNRIATVDNYRVTSPNDQVGLTTALPVVSLTNSGKPAQHFDGYNYLFVDGHVKFLRPEATVRSPGVTYTAGFRNANTYQCNGTNSSPCGMWTISEDD